MTSWFIKAIRINVPDLIKRDGQAYRVIMDHLESPVLVVNIADGTIVDQAEYNEWGRVIEQTNPTFAPFSFAGGLHDLDTKLVRFGARDYNPDTGRWMSKDPIGFAGQDANLYRYVNNNPINFNDPKEKVLGPLQQWFLAEVPCSDISRTKDTKKIRKKLRRSETIILRD